MRRPDSTFSSWNVVGAFTNTEHKSMVVSLGHAEIKPNLITKQRSLGNPTASAARLVGRKPASVQKELPERSMIHGAPLQLEPDVPDIRTAVLLSV